MYIAKPRIPAFDQAKVLVFGDIILDRYWKGETQRISPEAPVPVVHIKTNDHRLGGAANVALNVKSLGGSVKLFGMCGIDEAAAILMQLLQQEDIDSELLKIADLHTITKLRVLSMNQQLIRLDFEQSFAGIDKTTLIQSCINDFQNAGVLVLSDYGKGAGTDTQSLIQAAKKANLPVLVDPKSHDFTVYRGATLITPNFREFEAVVGACSDNEAIVEKARNLLQQCDFESILITRGAHGMTLVERDMPPAHLAANAHEVFDVTGAGDTVIAVTAASLAAGVPCLQAVQLANAAAGVVVGKVGTATVSFAELATALDISRHPPLGAMEENDLLNEILLAKSKGERIVMTNGCFDLIHSGHIMYLNQAKALGDRLIVAVNEDASVKRLKGENRPLNNTRRRMAVLAGLKPVDWVVPFSEDTPQRLIAKLLPDVLVKGGDWEVHQVAGAQEVLENGGEVKILGFEEGISTTSIINKMKE
ncbi:MAG: bifunctional D-glycero-beta-D-manno-heptose-7-phosphate kinase/D-glycero-beta-D-manno-heptose 1-phosphate adenylyltransferase HldE [Legionellales bacterium]|nr:bifunctional D-glycero-beta-D-manno-heptose-7-phosphate kinase/D-glycero-beta-D-manno-heptose 1-phosphate adenylyltransferase HldE [Legionellales bacterium]